MIIISRKYVECFEQGLHIRVEFVVDFGTMCQIIFELIHWNAFVSRCIVYQVCYLFNSTMLNRQEISLLEDEREVGTFLLQFQQSTIAYVIFGDVVKCVSAEVPGVLGSGIAYVPYLNILLHQTG